ncbi:uncharacterized protein LOC143626045 [Bidens hawaiensis]|uniref:uncharacterized protein LOC143626045 n=1 Tax=Bidens hawaiensis TaxID=980011 RepID=UPI0040498BE7
MYSFSFSKLEKDLSSNCKSFPDGFLAFLKKLMSETELENEFSKPMMWIGMYIALASLFCILPMLADLLHGLKTKKQWFLCKYFTLNAASLTVIAVTMKFPVDISNSMPEDVDQAAKLGSMAFMCTMMANLLPSLATMDSKELPTNAIALGVLVITLVVNVCIQIGTGVVPDYEGIQKAVVVACKTIALIPILFVIGILCGFHCWKRLNNVLVERPAQPQLNKDLGPYVLRLQDDIELAERTLKSISKSVNHVIQKAEKQKPNNLIELLEEYSGFEGVGEYDMHQVPPLAEEKYVDCWSLPVVTLTAVAISLPNIQKDIVDRLLKSVSEGLTYVTHMVAALNATDEYVSIQKVARSLWLEVEVYHKWLGYKLPNPDLQANATKTIV